ncbi:MAG TPA: TlpA disulfide reductase family protein [Actinomycetota bacterium]|jgi:peroxiredoxin|nr:TlpA disulfide reductase family protein [Actinomycetota bacterium]
MRAARSIAICVAVLAFAACTRAADESSAGGTGVRAVDEPLPTLSGPTLDGGQISSQDFLGKVLVVNVWANWCTPCQLEQPELVQVANRYAKRGVRFLGIDHQDQDAAAKAWVESYHVPYPSIADPTGKFAAALDYVGLPDTYVVDPTGTIRYAIGPGATSASQLSGVLDQVLAGQTSASSATATNSPAK